MRRINSKMLKGFVLVLLPVLLATSSVGEDLNLQEQPFWTKCAEMPGLTERILTRCGCMSCCIEPCCLVYGKAAGPLVARISQCEIPCYCCPVIFGCPMSLGMCVALGCPSYCCTSIGGGGA